MTSKLLAILILSLSLGNAKASIKAGQTIVKEKCLICHNISGKGMQMASDLAISYKEHDKEWSRGMITEPAKMLATDPIAKELLAKYDNVAMEDPKLSKKQVDDVIEFLDALVSGELEKSKGDCGDSEPEEEEEPILEGDPLVGEKLYTGSIPFKNRAASCFACHDSGTGTLGGGNFGNNLGHVYKKYNKNLPKALKKLPFPSMAALYKDKELTPEERYHLTAFFKKMHELNPPREKSKDGKSKKTSKMLNYQTGFFAGLSLIAFLVIFLLIRVLLPERNKGVREELLEKVNREKNR